LEAHVYMYKLNNAFILSPACFPGIDYLAILANCKTVEIDNSGNYIKQSFRNRFRLLTASGPMDVVVPVLHKAGVKQEMNSVEICYQENWQKRAWKTITSAYGKAPYFLYYADNYEQLFNHQTNLLIDWNALILAQLSRDLTFNLPVFCETWKPDHTDISDLREVIHPKKKSPIEIPAYHQVFSEKFNFQPGMSCIDLLFNLGPDASSFLRTIRITG
jgi:hypothetical protein